MSQYQHRFSIVFRNFWLKLIAGIVNVWLFGITAHGYAAPIITTDLADIVVISGTAASLQISAYDTMPLNYQWYLNTTNIPGATNAFLTFNNIQATDAGHYSVMVTNLSGSITSRLATVTVENYPNPTTIVAWGDNTYGETNVPVGETNVVALAAGQDQTFLLRRDGTLGESSQYFISSGTLNRLPHVATISSIGHFELALETNGTPISFGLTYYSGSSDVAAYVTNAVETAIGNPRLALLDNGTVIGWTPNPDYYHPSDPAHILGSITNLTNVIAIATSGGGVNSGSHCLALYSNHTVVAFGVSQAGDSTVVPNLRNVAAVSGGANFSLALKMDGTVVAWGNNSYGQTNVPIGLSNVMAIATGDYHSLALESNGMVVAWGQNTYGQCNVPTTLSNIVFITAGSRHSAVLTKQPGISVPAISQVIFSGGQATFNIVATGYQLLSYQWEFDGTNIAGATNSFLTLTNVPLIAAGVYQCVVSNAFGTCVSPPATLTVNRTTPRFDTSSSGLLFTNDDFVLNLKALSGHGAVIIYASTNLQSWLPIFTNPPVLGSLQFSDPTATNFPFRFYRALEQ
jgi:Regulator of chromosome condensation (RCC1) repeat